MSDDDVLVRAPVVRIIDHGSATTVIGREVTRRFDGDSAALLRAVLELYARPVSRAQLLRELARRAGLEAPSDAAAPPPGVDPPAGAPGSPEPVAAHDATASAKHRPRSAAAGVPEQPVDELVGLLVRDGVLVPVRATPGRPAPDRTEMPVVRRRVVLGISGAIAAVDAPALIRGLHDAGCDVRVALTRNARRLVSRAALEALTHHAVWTSLWQRDAGAPVPHINLAEWAELVVIYPASATTLSRIATGDCSDLVAAVVAATRAPVVVVPSLNDAMYESPAVQANLATLRDHGRHVVHPARGIEVAHQPHARPALLGPAPPVAAVLDIVRHLLRELAAPRMPDSPRGWEQLWSTTPPAQLPWHSDALEPPLAEAIAAHHGLGRRLLDIGTGDGIVAVAAAGCGFRVTATDVAPSALGRARDRAADAAAAITLVLDDVTASSLDASFDVAVDRGVLHCLPRDSRPAYAATVTRLVAAGGALIIVAHGAGAAPGTHGVAAADLHALLTGFEAVRTVATTLAGAPAALFELRRITSTDRSP